MNNLCARRQFVTGRFPSQSDLFQHILRILEKLTLRRESPEDVFINFHNKFFFHYKEFLIRDIKFLFIRVLPLLN